MVATALAGLLGALGGCGPNLPEPRVVAPRLYTDGPLWVCFCPYGDNPDKPIRIEAIRFEQNGRPIRPPVVIEPCKEGFLRGRKILFDPPDPSRAQRLELIARLVQDERHFRVVIEFRREPDGRHVWRRADEAVRSILIGP
jgi:hypothetical protein